MATHGFALFETAIGHCGVAWNGTGIAGLLLPDADAQATRALLLRRFPGACEAAPPPGVKSALDDIGALLRGDPRSLDGVVLDMSGLPPFHRRVYDAARAIPPGATMSYGEVAKRIGAPGAARAVGRALGLNPFPIVVPCHRVVAARGGTGGFSAYGGATTKLRLLAIEGARRDLADTGSERPPDRGPQTTAARERTKQKRSGPTAQRSLFDGDAAMGFDAAVAVRHLREADDGLARLIDAVGPFRMQLKETSSVFAALAEAIVYQQLTGKAAATIHARLCALFPDSLGGPSARDVLDAAPEELRSAGLSRAKVLALCDLAKRVESGALPSLTDMQSMEDDAIVECLTEVRGVGCWTVEMFLMFRLGRPDVLPVGDYGIRKGFAIAFRKRKLPQKDQLEKRASKWKPFRSVASWYLWRALKLTPAESATQVRAT